MRFVSDADRKELEALMLADLYYIQAQEDNQRWYEALGSTQSEQDMLGTVNRVTNMIGSETADELDDLYELSRMVESNDDTIVYIDERHQLGFALYYRRVKFIHGLPVMTKRQRHPYDGSCRYAKLHHDNKMYDRERKLEHLRRWQPEDLDEVNDHDEDSDILSAGELVAEDLRERERDWAIDELIGSGAEYYDDEFEDDETGPYVGYGKNRSYHTNP